MVVLRKISSAKEESKASEWPLAKAVVLLPCTAALMVAAAAVRQRYHCRRACKLNHASSSRGRALYFLAFSPPLRRAAPTIAPALGSWCSPAFGNHPMVVEGAHSTVVSLPPSFRGVLGSMYVRVLCSMFGMPLLTMAKVLSWEH